MRVLIRPLRPEDHVLYEEFGRHLTAEDYRMRFFSAPGDYSPQRSWRLTHYDPAQARAYVATELDGARMLGVGRIHRTVGDAGEFAVLVRSDLKGQGLGRELMNSVVAGARELALGEIWGLVLRENRQMLALCTEFGFTVSTVSGEPGAVEVRRLSA